jgi:hypothetical protein
MEAGQCASGVSVRYLTSESRSEYRQCSGVAGGVQGISDMYYIQEYISIRYMGRRRIEKKFLANIPIRNPRRWA